MKKYFILLFALCLFFPLSVQAEDTTDKLYIDINIKEDGSLFIRELAVLGGSYKGRLRNIEYQNPYAPVFTGQDSDFGGSDIYNGSSIRNIKVYDVLGRSSITFLSMEQLHQEFRKVSSASSGDYGVYTLQYTSSGIDLKIFNPSSKNSAFYIEYEVEDAVAVHQDVAELAWNILGNRYQENIEDLEVRVHLPGEDPTMRVWGHGPLNGSVERTDDQTSTIRYDFLGAYNAIDVRMVFDKNLVPNATKTTNINALEKILAYEKTKAEEANQQRDRIRMQNNIVKGITIGWYVLLIGTILVIYLKYDKEHKVNFAMQYYREFPNNYGPEILEYLLKKQITSNGFSASILEIVHKKGLKVEPIEGKKEAYKFIKQEENQAILTETEKDIVSLLINTIGNGQEVTLQEIKKYGKSVSRARTFMSKFQDWTKDSISIAKNYHFFQGNVGPKIIGCLVACLGWFIFLLNISFETSFILGYLSIAVAIIALVYFIAFKKRTEQGALEYQQWMAFKRFLLDFGRMDEKTLPEVSLWDKYLIYATVLGCAKKLEKEMKIKIESMNTTDPVMMNMTDYYMMNTLIRSNIASTVARTVNTAVSSSRSSIAASNSSSSGGFGGGMSSGGGSFGGGGGGGRF